MVSYLSASAAKASDEPERARAIVSSSSGVVLKKFLLASSSDKARTATYEIIHRKLNYTPFYKFVNRKAEKFFTNYKQCLHSLSKRTY